MDGSATKHDGGWVTSESNYLFESKWFKLRQDQIILPTGENITYTLVDHPGYAMVVPLMENGDLVLEHIYRHTVQETVIECPSGGLDGEPQEIAARRELLEETGWQAETLISLGSYFGSNGISNEQFHIFLGKNLTRISEPDREPTEQMKLEFVPIETAVDWVYTGKISDAPSSLAILLAKRYLDEYS